MQNGSCLWVLSAFKFFHIIFLRDIRIWVFFLTNRDFRLLPGVDHYHVRRLAVAVDGNCRGKLESELLRRVPDGCGRRIANGLHGEQRAVLGRPTGAGESFWTVLSSTQTAGGVWRWRRVVQVFWHGRAGPTVAVATVGSEEQSPFPFRIRL